FNPGQLHSTLNCPALAIVPEHQFVLALLQEIAANQALSESETTAEPTFTYAVPNLAYLHRHFGSARVQATDCQVPSINGQPQFAPIAFDCQEQTVAELLAAAPPTVKSTLPDFWTLVCTRMEQLAALIDPEPNDLTRLFGNLLTFSPQKADQPAPFACALPPRFYLKDWHMVQQFPAAGAYQTPDLFSDDWINEFWDYRQDTADDYRFVYIGGPGTWTPFHADVFNANICGIKRWTLYPPGQESLFTDPLGNTLLNIHDYDSNRYPHFSQAKCINVFQMPGQTLFVPSGWAHQVENIGDAISINHNWGNGYNLPILYEALQKELSLVEHAIRDCAGMDGWDQHCQVLLRANHGMNFADFFQLIQLKATRLMAHLEGVSDANSSIETSAPTAIAPHFPLQLHYQSTSQLPGPPSLSHKAMVDPVAVATAVSTASCDADLVIDATFGPTAHHAVMQCPEPQDSPIEPGQVKLTEDGLRPALCLNDRNYFHTPVYHRFSLRRIATVLAHMSQHPKLGTESWQVKAGALLAKIGQVCSTHA
ncbi:JmjC domain-containing protein 4, partial [Dimargaris xerosporica]